MSSAGPSAASAGSPHISAAKVSSSASSIDERKPRTLILCFDGTAEQYDGENTNVVKFYSLLKKDDDEDQQLCYYQPGVGTYFNPGVVSPLFQWAAKILDEAFAWYLDAHVRGGYQFLMQNYVAGDKICLFGFSRGAYTARALAGMLHKIGLLPRDNPEQIPFAYKLYKQTDKDSLELAAGFKQTFCRNVEIEFVGVLETVSSVGVLMTRTLPFTTANTTIKRFRHALSLDEHRVRFLPNFYHRATPQQASPSSSGPSGDRQTDVFRSHAEESKHARLSRGLFGSSRKFAANVAKAKLQQDRLKFDKREGIQTKPVSSRRLAEDALNDHISGGTDVLEVWFAGCHGDVGGGNVANNVEVSLSDITLRWMVREVVLAQCGIAFDEAALVRANIPESIFRGEGFPLPAQTTFSRHPQHNGFSVDEAGSNTAASQDGSNGGAHAPLPKSEPRPTEATPDDGLDCSADALAPLHDMLKSNPTWWLLEIVPTWYKVQQPDGTWKTSGGGYSSSSDHLVAAFHMGRGREIPQDTPPNFHVTVRERMQDPSLKYTPRAKYAQGKEVYVS
ncbi:hypothetical protein PYCCODRAFT_1463594 [Trametes coccinea BRFM310]|uniref:T6SS Phospholipase effector Tle1-like catalytic domain-containing protein n=1 Tax=Trametes coccinea (strain BRFM310) TaxID=1353009 RepID=A0A1Y2J1V0_TRAC3|nr:hypothetical protein PYCCODRAFT_1463594 [Trametes coccinea BRFM310]